ncbi:MAG: glycerophosphodiester phosphodiesterase [Tannerellaceae bacterium]|jgi:glycerophosphoryl diester phosphodiesterase|nr:glycerophosphodiester phosphodiesterase [Tannerellaceae bacterium]
MNLRFLVLLLAGAGWIVGAVSAQTRVIAHRGYWDTEGSAQNSIASLHKAGEAGVYGSEFDVLMTQDGVLVVNHDDSIQAYHIETTPYHLLENLSLSNGERLPTLESYLEEGKKHLPTTRLILELKPHRQESNERRAAEAVVAMVKEKGLQQAVEYISFSLFICKELLRLSPQAQIAYLGGDIRPGELKQAGLSGLDYHHGVLTEKPEWIQEAKEAGLSINVWTVNSPELMESFIRQGVDYITTDKPEELLRLLQSF